MHGHINRQHYDQYKAAGFNMEQLTEGYKRKSQAERNNEKSGKSRQNSEREEKKDMSQKEDLKNARPKNLRLLNKSSRQELDAYNEGYRYFDPDERIAYTKKEVEEEGWI